MTLAISGLVVGCGQSVDSAERLAGAERALAALPQVEIVSTDTRRGLITIRDRASGGLSVIDVTTAALPAAAAPASTALPTGPVQSSPSPEIPAPDEPAAAWPQATAEQLALEASSGAAERKVVRDDRGRLARLEGPGYRVERVGADGDPALPPAGGANASTADSLTSAAPAEGMRRDGLRRRSDPIVCRAGERLEVEAVDIVSPAAGIVAERGCDLLVANSRVRADGWGLVVNRGARVRLENSAIEGRVGSVDLNPGAQLTAWASTFRGPLGQPLAAPEFADRGGNRFDQ